MQLVEMRKEEDFYFEGPFWITANSLQEIREGKFKILAERYLVDFYGKPVSKVEPSKSTHKYIWETKYQEVLRVDYNYFPRGRVVFREGHLYLNIPQGLPLNEIQAPILQAFDYRREFDQVFYKDPTTGGHYSFLLK